jgi:zinc protease
MGGVELRTLPNGLRLLIREQHAAPLVAVDAWVRAGSGREQEGESGAAHFLEHLLFKGTPTRKPGEIDAAIEDLGATLSAYTLRDAAHFCTTVPSGQAKTAVVVLADALRNSVLDPAEVERERSVILDEIARGGNDVRKLAVNLIYGELAKGTPYARPVLGDPASIRSLSRDSIAAFYKRWYTPGNTTVVLVGDVTPDAAEKMVRDAFDGWSGTSPQPNPVAGSGAPMTSAPITATAPAIPPDSQLVATGIGIVTEYPAVDAATGLVIAALLGDNRSGAIAASLAQPKTGAAITPDKSTAVDVETTGTFLPADGPEALLLMAQAPRARTSEARNAIDSAIETVRRTPPSADRLDAARRSVIGPYLYDIETYAGQASALGHYDVLGDYTAAQTLVDRILALKPDDLSAFARAHLDSNARADILINPASGPQ